MRCGSPSPGALRGQCGACALAALFSSRARLPRRALTANIGGRVRPDSLEDVRTRNVADLTARRCSSWNLNPSARRTWSGPATGGGGARRPGAACVCVPELTATASRGHTVASRATSQPQPPPVSYTDALHVVWHVVRYRRKDKTPAFSRFCNCDAFWRSHFTLPLENKIKINK